MLQQSAVDAINDKLGNVLVKGSHTILLSDLDDSEYSSESFLSICVDLLEMLSRLDNRVICLSVDSVITISHIYNSIIHLCPPFLESSSLLKYRLISFLCAHCQVRLITVRQLEPAMS